MVKQEEDPIDLTSDDEETGRNPGAKPPGKKNAYAWTKVATDALKKGVKKHREGQYRSLF